MGVKEDIIAAVQAVADASGDNQARIGLGAPGSIVLNLISERQETGKAWTPSSATFNILIGGIANYLVSQGDVPTLKAKINEVISAYMQFKTDYNNGTVPTTAPDVLPLP